MMREVLKLHTFQISHSISKYLELLRAFELILYRSVGRHILWSNNSSLEGGENEATNEGIF